jgi:hypothetical protein
MTKKTEAAEEINKLSSTTAKKNLQAPRGTWRLKKSITNRDYA